MKLEITSIKKNPLLARREVTFKIVESSTPSRAAVRKELTTKIETDLDNVYVKNIETKTGTRLTNGIAHIYDEKESALKIEPKYVIERNRISETEEEIEGSEQEEEEEE